MQPLTARCAFLAALLLTVLVACSQQGSKDAQAPREGAARTEAAAADKAGAAVESPPPAPAAMESKNASPGVAQTVPVAAQLTSSAVTATDAQRKFIRTAHADFRVKDVYRSALAIEDIVAAHGGFVVHNDIAAETQSTQRRARGDGKLVELTEYVTRGTMVVRVPSGKTQAFLLAIVGQVDFLDHRTFDATDAQFDMLRQQLVWQRSQESQQDIGQAEQQGGKLDQRTDAVQMREQAKAVRDEALVAQKEFEDKVAFSTIDLSLYETPKIRMTEMVDAEAEFQRNSPGFFERIGSSLRSGWFGLLDIVVAAVSVWPLWMLVLGCIALVRYFAKRRSSP